MIDGPSFMGVFLLLYVFVFHMFLTAQKLLDGIYFTCKPFNNTRDISNANMQRNVQF